ncbi:hypothetical protein F7725_020779 [Dissostichus mawsoni]|uniref:Uncharacterized protein n=1 Tax=Dissostichus mawsoni TaxID=36200 RepID=A0A7J5YFG6_DISMA|nr:hypothetical protein F7725_020779 [Dissostichus mawsoni]
MRHKWPSVETPDSRNSEGERGTLPMGDCGCQAEGMRSLEVQWRLCEDDDDTHARAMALLPEVKLQLPHCRCFNILTIFLFLIIIIIEMILKPQTSHSNTAILDDPMECSRGERLAITLAKEPSTGAVTAPPRQAGVCQIMSKGVVAVLGPSASPASNSIISNICGEKELTEMGRCPLGSSAKCFQG